MKFIIFAFISVVIISCLPDEDTCDNDCQPTAGHAGQTNWNGQAGERVWF